jgi:peroxiredoxin
VQAEKTPHLGEEIPGFTLVSDQGDTVSLSDYERSTVMLFTMGFG